LILIITLQLMIIHAVYEKEYYHMYRDFMRNNEKYELQSYPFKTEYLYRNNNTQSREYQICET